MQRAIVERVVFRYGGEPTRCLQQATLAKVGLLGQAGMLRQREPEAELALANDGSSKSESPSPSRAMVAPAAILAGPPTPREDSSDRKTRGSHLTSA